MEQKTEKVALVTGASRGIGKAIALVLAESGYHLAVNYRSGKREAEEVCEAARHFGVQAYAFYADVGNLKELTQMYEQIDKVFSKIDLVVNNAGSSSEVYFLDATEEMFDQMNATDWKSVFFSSQLAAKRMIQAGVQGVIINISSNQVEGCWPRASIYAPTKAAVSKFTKNAAMELVPYGIRMVAVAPGYTDVGWEPEDHRYEAAKRLPMKRFATTREIAECVKYLASSQASYITGTTVVIDGGATLPVIADNDFVK